MQFQLNFSAIFHMAWLIFEYELKCFTFRRWGQHLVSCEFREQFKAVRHARTTEAASCNRHTQSSSHSHFHHSQRLQDVIQVKF